MPSPRSTQHRICRGMLKHQEGTRSLIKVYLSGAISLLAFIIACQIVNGVWEQNYARSHTYVKGEWFSHVVPPHSNLFVPECVDDQSDWRQHLSHQGRATKHSTWTLPVRCALHHIPECFIHERKLNNLSVNWESFEELSTHPPMTLKQLVWGIFFDKILAALLWQDYLCQRRRESIGNLPISESHTSIIYHTPLKVWCGSPKLNYQSLCVQIKSWYGLLHGSARARHNLFYVYWVNFYALLFNTEDSNMRDQLLCHLFLSMFNPPDNLT